MIFSKPVIKSKFIKPIDQLTAVIENSENYILISDEKGVPQLFNTAYAKIMKEILGLEMKPGIQVHKLLKDPEVTVFWEGLHKRVLDGEKFKIEYPYIVDQKKTRFFTFSFCPIYKDGIIRGFTEISKEITDFKRKEDQLLDSKERYQMVSDLTSDYAYGFRVEEDHEIVNEWVTGAFKRITGYTKKELVSDGGWEKLIYPGDMHIVLNQLKDLLKGNAKTVEYRILDKNKNIIWVLDYARPVMDKKNERVAYIFGATRDITKAKLAREELQEKAIVVEQADESIIITNRKGVISYVNPAFEKISGYKQSELLGENFKILKSEKQDDKFYNKMWKKISKGEVWSGNIINRMKDGKFCEFETTISPIKDQNDKIIKYVSINRDITQEKDLEERLVQAQKMEAVGTLAGGIAHDFNNILAGIIGYAELALMDCEKGTQIYKNISKSLSASEHARELIKQILFFSRKKKQEFKPLNVEGIISDVIELLRISLSSFIEIEHLYSSNSSIMADSSQIHQILMNLCTNAAHAMRDNGGVLQILTEDVVLPEDFCENHEYIESGKYLKISVKDTGHGFEQKMANKIFDPFFTTKKMGKGTGLGLAVVHGIVKNHKGAIIVKSLPGKGTIFDIFIPSIDIEDEALVNKEVPLFGGSENILMVDDEIAQLDIGKQLLERLGYNVTIENRSINALALIEKDPDLFDLVITDMTMPNMQGDQLVKKILKIKPAMPVILCTGFSEKISKEKALEIGVAKYMEKPIQKNMLALSVREVLDK